MSPRQEDYSPKQLFNMAIMAAAWNDPDRAKARLQGAINGGISITGKVAKKLVVEAIQSGKITNPGVTLLQETGFPLDTVLQNGDTLLHVAARNQPNDVLIRRLREAGLDPNLQNKAGDTPLHLARDEPTITALTLPLSVQEHGKNKVLEGCDPNIPNKQGKTPASIILDADRGGSLSALRLAGAYHKDLYPLNADELKALTEKQRKSYLCALDAKGEVPGKFAGKYAKRRASGAKQAARQ